MTGDQDRFPPSERSRVKRFALLARYDRETIHRILDEAFIVHVGYAVVARPWAKSAAPSKARAR